MTISENLKVYHAQQQKMLYALAFQRRAFSARAFLYYTFYTAASSINLGSAVNLKLPTSTGVYRAKKVIKSTVAKHMGKATKPSTSLELCLRSHRHRSISQRMSSSLLIFSLWIIMRSCPRFLIWGCVRLFGWDLNTAATNIWKCVMFI